jgi:hypothetical protein
MPQRRMWLNHGSGQPASELVSPWRCRLLDSELLSTGLYLLPSMMSVTLLNGEVGFWLWQSHTHGNHHRLCSRSYLYQWCGYRGSEQSSRVTPSRRRQGEASFPAAR